MNLVIQFHTKGSYNEGGQLWIKGTIQMTMQILR
jgi:hypothetical protein